MGVTGAACFCVELSPASLLMIERRSMVFAIRPPSTAQHRASAPYPRLGNKCGYVDTYFLKALSSEKKSNNFEPVPQIQRRRVR
jgi:hypothetical protein